MAKKYLKIEGVRQIANTLSGDAREFADAVIAAFEEAEQAEEEHDITSLKTSIDEIAARFAEQNEEVAERIAKVKNEILRTMQGGGNVKDKFTPELRAQVVNAIMSARGIKDVQNNIDKVMAENGIEVRKKNAVTGLSYAEIIDYALQLKQENNDEIFDALYKTNRSKWFYGELDPTDPTNIAKQWSKSSLDPKAEQTLALEGKTIATAYVYKLQSLANEDLDDAREAGQEAELLRDVRDELERAVKGLAVRAIFVGDAYNASGSKVSTFETIGTKNRSDLFTTVVAPAAANAVTLADVRKAAAKVKTDRKWAIVTEDTKLALATRLYAAGGTEFFFTDEELAAQLGVDRVIAKDFIGDVDGLKAIIFDPNEYWVKEKNVIDTPFPDYRNNRQGLVYEINMGGAVHGLQSTAILKVVSGSSSK